MFLPNVPGATFIPGATSIPESRVCTKNQNSSFFKLKSAAYKQERPQI